MGKSNKGNCSGDMCTTDCDSSDDVAQLPLQTTAPSPLPVGTTGVEKKPSWTLYRIALAASLGGVLFGYDMGIIAAALPSLQEDFSLSNRQQELVVAVLYAGGGFGALSGGMWCDANGRRQTILAVDVVFVLGALTMAFANSFGVLVFGRIVTGYAMAVAGLADVTYLHECTPFPEWRGSLVSLHEACIALGFLVAWAVGGSLAHMGESSDPWRYMFAFSGAVAMIQFALMLALPESPEWLFQNGRATEGNVAIQNIAGESVKLMYVPKEESPITSTTPPEPYTRYDAIDVENTETKNVETEMMEVVGAHGLTGAVDWVFTRATQSWGQLVDFFTQMRDPRYKRQAYIAIFLALSQQFCGQTVVLAYAPYLFAAGDPSSSETASSYVDSWTTLSVGVVKFVVTCVVVARLEYIGRRLLLLSGIAVLAVGLLCLILAYLLPVPTGLSVLGVLLVVMGYSMSFGPLTWLLTSELVPTQFRGRALGVSTILTYFGASFVTYTFLSFSDYAGLTFVFSGYFCLTVLAGLFAYTAIPDTCGQTSADDLARGLDELWFWRRGSVMTNVTDLRRLQSSDLV